MNVIYKILLVILLLLMMPFSITQVKNRAPVKYLRESRKYEEFTIGRRLIYPYGGTQIYKRNNNLVVPILLFNNKIKYHDIKILNNVDYSNSVFADSVYFYNVYFTNTVCFDNALFENYSDFNFDIFDSNATFDNCKFNRVGFNFIDFEDTVDFGGCTYLKNVGYVATYFINMADFSNTHFMGEALFNNSRFMQYADFRHAKFRGLALFNQSYFMSYANFAYTIFDSTVNLSDAFYNKGISLEHTVIKEMPILNETQFKKNIILTNAKFLNGLDLRRVNMDSVKTIVIDENTYYPDGTLFVKWEQIKERIQPFQEREYGDEEVIYSRRYITRDIRYEVIKIVYQKLHDNYLKQGNTESAKNVLYELCKQRAKILKEWHWILYGWFFGWGYQSWRFQLFIGLLVGLTALVNKKKLNTKWKIITSSLKYKNQIIYKSIQKEMRANTNPEKYEINTITSRGHIISISDITSIIFKIINGKCYVQLNHESLCEVNEMPFVQLLYMAVVRKGSNEEKMKEWISKNTELYITTANLDAGEIREACGCPQMIESNRRLKAIRLNTNIKGSYISIDNSIYSFRSIHWDIVETELNNYKKWLKKNRNRMVNDDTIKDINNSCKIFVADASMNMEINDEILEAMRNTMLVSNALKLLGKTQKWQLRNKYNQARRDIDGILHYLGMKVLSYWLKRIKAIDNSSIQR